MIDLNRSDVALSVAQFAVHISDLKLLFVRGLMNLFKKSKVVFLTNVIPILEFST